MKKGDSVFTPYGEGVISSYRETDNVCVVELPYATLYAPTTESKSLQQNRTMELNVAYEALDQMRKQNLEVECHLLGLQEVNHNQCTMCLLTPRPHQKRFPRIQRYRANRKQAQGCLCCGSPVCGQHSCPNFRKEGIPVCVGCEQLFTLDFVIDCMTAYPEKRREHVNHMMNVYDRVVLLYLYSMQFVDQVAAQLQKSTRTHNHVSVTSSSVGMLSGVLGVAAAATILTPAGPPLLIASLLFGGSASAVQTGTEVRNYYSEPNQLADRIFALHGIVHSILRTTSILRDALMRNSLRKDGLDEDDKVQDTQQEMLEDCSTVMTGLAVSRHDVAKLESEMEPENLPTVPEVGTTAGRKARFATKTAENAHLVTKTGAVAGRHAHLATATGTGLMRVARVARFAGGALSAATLLVETKCMTNTIQQIQAGSPCEKADMLHHIKKGIEELPTTESLHGECMSYLEAMSQHERCMTEDEVIRLLMDASRLEDFSDEGTLSHDKSQADAPEEPPNMIESQGSDKSGSPKDDNQKKSASLILGRIKRYKKRRNKDVVATYDNPDAIPIASLG